MADKTCWALSDGKAGNENPCLGLAEAVGFDITVKHIYPRAPWRWLPPGLWFDALNACGPPGDRLTPPWPDLLIACGRQSVAPAIAIRRAARAGGRRCYTVQILDPKRPAGLFDLIAAPRHDGLAGDNVIATRGALHRVSPERLATAAAQFAGLADHLPRPRVAVLVGGASKRHRMTLETAAALGQSLDALVREAGCGLMVTVSRRTGAANEAALRSALDNGATYFWDGAGDNPYFALLGLADAVIVTGDSVAMVSEACATGKPVYVYDLPGGSAKFDRFHGEMRDAGCTRPFRGIIEDWSYEPVGETARVAAEIRRRMALD